MHPVGSRLYNRSDQPRRQTAARPGEYDVEFRSLRVADVVVAVPVGRIDHSNAERLQRALGPVVEASAAAQSPVVLDFAGVDYICSMGLRVLLLASKTMRSQHCRIAVASLQPVVEEIFSISRFDHVLEVFPSVHCALEAISAPALAAYHAQYGASE